LLEESTFVVWVSVAAAVIAAGSIAVPARLALGVISTAS
jgi:hypothetical protein